MMSFTDDVVGNTIPDKSRRLVTVAGKEITVYAAPTTRGGLCWSTLRGDVEIQGSCDHRDFGWAFTDRSSQCHWPLQISGVVPDQVRAVEVRIGQRRQSAVMGTNGFYLAARDPKATQRDIAGFLVHLRDGRTIETKYYRSPPGAFDHKAERTDDSA
jgi:hypothetical protein